MAKSSRKNQQMIALILGSALVVGLAVLTFGFLGPKNPTANPFGVETNEVDVSIVADRTSAAAPEMSWVTTSKVEIERLSGVIEQLQKSMQAQEQNTKRRIAEVEEGYDDILVQQAAKIAALESAKATAPSLPQPNQAGGDTSLQQIFAPNYDATGSEFINKRTNTRTTNTQQRQAAANQQLDNDAGLPLSQTRTFGQSFKLASVKSGANSKIVRNTLRDYVPAGSYVSAVVMSGADAATNVSDRENPIPVLFRITGAAVTAGRGSKGAKINLRGCTVQGSAVGDLSSERVKVRLLSMACLDRRGHIIETKVSGYMTGAGKAGVRGRVVSREGGLVTNAAIAGAFQGLAGAAQPQQNLNSEEGVSNLAKRAASMAGAGGVQQAASTLSEYYVKRAEQYQPVISLNGGTTVELVFLEGVSLK